MVRLLAPSTSRADPELDALLLSTDPADVALVSELLHRLLQCVHESHNAAAPAAPTAAARDELARTAEIALQCLGQLGAHDPAKIGTRSMDAVSSTNGGGTSAGGAGASSGGSGKLYERGDIEHDEILAERLLEGPLLRMMRSAGEGHVPAAGYAAMVLLQQVGLCSIETPSMLHIKEQRDRAKARGMADPDSWSRLSPSQQSGLRLWSRLAENTRHAVAPYLTLKAEPAEAFRPVASPIYSPASVYSDWIVTWCRQLLAAADLLRSAEDGRYLDSEQRRRATLLVAMYACVRYDARLALSLLPLAILFLLTAAPLGLASLAQIETDRAAGRPSRLGLEGAHRVTCAQIIKQLLTEINAVLLRGGEDHHNNDAARAELTLCCQALFEIFDTLSELASFYRRRNETAPRRSPQRSPRPGAPQSTRAAALRAGSHCRALRYLETFADTHELSRPEHGIFTAPACTRVSCRRRTTPPCCTRPI